MKRILSITAVVCSTAMAPTAMAEWDGLGLIPGETWQTGLETFLSIPFAAPGVEEDLLHQPFFVPQAKSHGLTAFRNQSVRLSLQAKHLDEDGESEHEAWLRSLDLGEEWPPV